MNKSEMNAMIALIVLFFIGAGLIAIGYHFISPTTQIPYYVMGSGVFLLVMFGLFTYKEIRPRN